MTEFNYRWTFDTQAPPEAMWARMSDTNRFNRDTGIPALNARVIEQRGATRHLGFRFFGVPVEWEEEPFEWVRPLRFSVVRRYTTGPLKQLIIRCELVPRPDGGTRIVYGVRVTSGNLIGTLAIPIQIGFLSRIWIERAIREYDAKWNHRDHSPTFSALLVTGGQGRLDTARRQLLDLGFESRLIDALFSHINYGDDVELARIRPYELAERWSHIKAHGKAADRGAPVITRRGVLELCLHATRLGILDLEWDLLCPLCRGTSTRAPTLSDVQKQVHCPSCNIDYEVNFDRSVELTFHPNSAVRQIETRIYCVGGPQVTPHIFAQHQSAPHTQTTLNLPLEAGRYRVRTPQKRGGQYLYAESDGSSHALLRADDMDWSGEEPRISLAPELTLENATDQDQLFILERWAWSDQSVTAADVTALQTFRDLFASEALRSGEQFSVGGLTLVFTDLKRSTELYREIGDAPAFGRVLNHFAVIRDAVAADEGAIVKTMGDAVMAVFRRPVNALRAMQRAQSALANPPDGMLPLALKVGIHSGTCIAVTLNSRFDYFGTNVNIAARMAGLSNGSDILLSDAVWNDSEVMQFLASHPGMAILPFEARLRGYEESFALRRIVQTAPAKTPSPHATVTPEPPGV